MITATRRLQYAIGHRVHRHESKCRNLHGHNYVFLLTAQAYSGTPLDDLGRVIDFSVLKDTFGRWLELNWDHGFLVWDRDEEALAALRLIGGQKFFKLPENPTAENMALYLLHTVGPNLLEGTGILLSKVVVFETENCTAEASL